MRALFLFLILPLIVPTNLLAQRAKTDAHIFGHVVNGDKHIPFASVSLKGTTIGTSTDETGHFTMINLPVGTFTIVANAIGYHPVEKEIVIVAGQTLEVDFNLEEDAIGLDEIVISADRNEQRRKESSVVVNTISPKVFNMTQSVTLGEGLNFCPGLRLENNCQNCGFTQIRMNGMEGPYTQILINSRPIFSGLAGVYGLELIPSNMVDRVEVIRGGGSAMYGSNAIAGTVNLILRDPINNSYEFGINSGLTGVGMSGTGGIAPDHSVNFNTSVVSPDLKTGLAVYGFTRSRNPFDANNDSFSELTELDNTSLGARIFHRFGHRSKLSGDYLNIRETRRGGDRFEYPLHEAFIAEAVDHNINTAALTYDQFFRESDLLSVFASGQIVDRASYYGAEQSLSDYGQTDDYTYTIGSQYRLQMNGSSLIIGAEHVGSNLKDVKLGYPNYENATIDSDGILDVPHTDNLTVADQQMNISGAFAQYEIRTGMLTTNIGLRYDHYRIEDRETTTDPIIGNVLSPRLALRYEILPQLQARASYAMGYRAPQIFDEDLHIETSGSRQVLHRNDPDLEQETSQSIMASVDFSHTLGSSAFNILVEGFYTILQNPFANEFGDPDENGTIIYTRVNEEDGAVVQGVNLEFTFIPSRSVNFRTGFTIQQSKFNEEQEFDEKRFFRTPNSYGFYTLDWAVSKKLGLATTGTYTGAMLIPYFGPEIDSPEEGILRRSDPFMDLGARIRYNIKVNGATVQLFGGIKNIFNSYQSDFDRGIERDPGYMYGPNQPRTVYLGLRIGNRI